MFITEKCQSYLIPQIYHFLMFYIFQYQEQKLSYNQKVISIYRINQYWFWVVQKSDFTYHMVFNIEQSYIENMLYECGYQYLISYLTQQSWNVNAWV